MGRRGGPGDRLVDWIESVAAAADTSLQTAEDIYRMADRLPDDLEKRLDECLKSGDWQLQLAAADVAGQFDVQSAVPALLNLLEEEADQPPHPGLSRSWNLG
jgi:HEAT repeat protein